jgi:hypothetical protein
MRLDVRIMRIETETEFKKGTEMANTGEFDRVVFKVGL